MVDEGRDIAPARAKQRALLAVLLLHRNELLTADRLIDDLWGAEPPDTAGKALQGHVSALRKLLGAERIETEGGGYRLRVDPGELDVDRFESALRSAKASTDPGDRARRLAEAIVIWRGEPLADFAFEAFARADIARLDALRLAALEELGDAELALGRHAEHLPELERLVARHPLREGLRAQLMLALYRSNRQSEALRAFRDGRRVLAEELGIEPGAQLQALERRILEQDPGLDTPAAARALPRQERKVLTVLVAEIRSATPADPEDLARTTGSALDRMRAVVERFGGTSERLFANAILGVFGAPRAHDDDTERAVRAALELRDQTAAGGVDVHIGIERGDALVTIEGGAVSIAGDVLAQASHLQASAPARGVVVGESVLRSTTATVDYAGVGPGMWRALGLRAASSAPAVDTPFVGRNDELGVLQRAFQRARNEHAIQLATVIAEPGGGKTRLIAELRAALEASGEPHVWRQGRCLPYGEGVTYWALGQIAKAQAEILESDASDVSERKLSAAVAALEPDEARRAWLDRGLAALVGIEGAAASGDRQQAFAVWGQFLESIAAHEPLVLVFEDIHWADAAMLEFIEHLVSHASGVQIVVVCTARLELLEDHPAWGGGKRNATTIALAPLTDDETEHLLRSLLGRPPKQATIRRAGGNPLFARELAMIVERLGSEDSTGIPESLHAVISARLDALPVELKAIACDAAVVGEVFWPGALSSIAGIPEPEIEERLHRLVANDVARRRRASSVARQSEYSFLHILVRDVAYGQIPRRDRAAKHRAAAGWIERLAGDRVGDHAELIAHHYVQALELAIGLGDDAEASELRPHARRFLTLAGEHVQRLDVIQAEQFYQRALDLTSDGDPDRGRLLSRLADVAQYTGRLVEAEQLSEAAIAILQAHGDPLGAGEAMVTLSVVRWRLARPDEDRRRPAEEAIRILEQLPPGKELVQAYARLGTHEIQGGRAQACRDWSQKALDVANVLGIGWLRNQPLQYLGIAKFELGDLSGIDDIREALAIGLQTGLSWETATAYSDLADPTWLVEGPAAALALKRTSADFAQSRGLLWYMNTVRADLLWLLYEVGSWDELLASADEMLAWDREHGVSRVSMIASAVKARVFMSRGQSDQAMALEGDYLVPAEEIGDPQDLVPALATAAGVRQGRGDLAGAFELIEQLERITRGRDVSRRVQELPIAARVCAAAGATAVAEALIPAAGVAFARGQHCVTSARAIIAEARGELEASAVIYATAASGWDQFGCPAERAEALLGQARCLAATHRLEEANTAIRAARTIASGLGARPLLAEAQAITATHGPARTSAGRRRPT